MAKVNSAEPQISPWQTHPSALPRQLYPNTCGRHGNGGLNKRSATARADLPGSRWVAQGAAAMEKGSGKMGAREVSPPRLAALTPRMWAPKPGRCPPPKKTAKFTWRGRVSPHIWPKTSSVTRSLLKTSFWVVYTPFRLLHAIVLSAQITRQIAQSFNR